MREYIGLTEEQGRKLAILDGFEVRVRSKDGEGYRGTCDVNTSRINFTIENGIITSARLG
jgi:hypothetical protein